MNVETIEYGGWSNCFRLSNDKYTAIITTDVGPRVLWFGLNGGDNLFCEVAEQRGLTGGDEWLPYGGHRLWHAPEEQPRTYQPDNDTVDHFELDNIHYFVPPVEAKTGIQKQISIFFKDDTMVVDHTFTNQGMWAIDVAPWAITMMKAGGVSIMPLPPHVAHDIQLQPTHALTLWGYTSLNDSRLVFNDKYILLRQDSTMESPLKIGLQVNFEYLWSVGWLAYVNNGTMFVKSFQPPMNRQSYTDLGTQVEIFTDDTMLELETLGGLRTLHPDQTITHREYWSAHADVTMTEDDVEIGNTILPLIRGAHPNVGRRKTGPLGRF